jgi:hypothetical protein
VAETGVGPYHPTEDYITVKAYYQWVPFVLFLQGSMFYIPHLVFKNVDGGKIKLIIAGLNQWVVDDEDRHSKESELANYLIETRGTHTRWCLQIMASSFLYLVIIRTYAEEENCEAIFRRSGSEFIILRMHL